MRDICSDHHLNDRPHQPVARGAAGWLAFAAAPVFAVMALLTHLSGGDMLCTAAPGASSLTGMTTMYALMSAFHLSPWLRLMASDTQVIKQL